MGEMRKVFCVQCQKETSYSIINKKYKQCIKGKEYLFDISGALCNECGEEMNIPGLLDSNAKKIDKQYRALENIVSIEEIYNLMEVYNIGKAPLSMALGFGEITITRYLQGQVPSLEYSDIIKKALRSPDFMIKCLEQNKDKVGNTAYNKAYIAADSLCKMIEGLSDKMISTISYMFEIDAELTPLALQKILYFIQGLHMILYKKTLFIEEPQAWSHGPVYTNVYDVFKEFKYNPIEDKKFIIFKGKSDGLSLDEKHVIEIVVNTFGKYSGKTLEVITNKEEPWRAVYEDTSYLCSTNSCISNNAIFHYYKRLSEKYNLKTEDGINEYINNQLAG
ncbi:MAG: DUF4065 domain-containing protein [Lachnospiraceae bacterium]|nr:DUF4065 domain-containing protein [Lachnospiraceae bacterium]